MSLLTFTDLCIAFGDKYLLDHANLSLEAGMKLGLIGRNGEGKSTLLKMIDGKVDADGGEIRFKPGARISMLEQSPMVAESVSVFEYVSTGLGETGATLAAYQNLSSVQSLSDKQLARLSTLQQQLDNSDGWNLQATVEKTLSLLALDGLIPVCELSGGWQRRASLARSWVVKPDILLLDEPTNHLDVESIIWLEKQILQFKGAVVFVTHDREFLQRVATDIAELDRGNLKVWPGSYQDYLTRKAASLEQEERQNAVFDKKLAQEEVWIRQGIKARRSRNEGRVRALDQMRLQQSERRRRKGHVKLQMEQGQQSGKIVIEAVDIHYRIALQEIISPFSCRIMRGDRIGLIGPNGIGKTTLLRLLLKELKADGGEVRHGTRMEVAYFDQLRADLDPTKSVVDIIGQGRDEITINGKSKHVISYLSDFLFTPERSRSPIKALSGGERARVLLARLFSKTANLLIMDEPTNDLDIETLELLEERLLQYDGTLLLVSHDRRFIDHVVTSTFSFEGQGVVKEYVGGYGDWLRQTKANKQEKSKNFSQPESRVSATDTQKNASQTPASQSSSNRKKPGYNQQRELDQLPQRIEKLEWDLEKLTKEISEPRFYNQSPEWIKERTLKLKSISDGLDDCYQRWAELDS